MNDTLKTIADRYSCRDFADTPLTEEQVTVLVDAALASPSAMNRQPWHIIMVTDKALIDEMDAKGMNSRNGCNSRTAMVSALLFWSEQRTAGKNRMSWTGAMLRLSNRD